ncbi:MAG: dienelactone hydrolase family protein [Actinomycetota bacterium]
MDVRAIEIDTTTSDGDMAIVVTEPATPPPADASWPVIVIFIDAPGLRPATREYMARLAGHGYRVITPDLHHRHGRLRYFEPKDAATNPDARPTITSWIASMTDDQIQSDFQDALAACGVGAEEPIGVIGFCLGARAVFRAMERDERVRCGAGWHPSFLADDGADSPHLTAASLDRPLYLGIGEADEVQSIEMHRRFLDAVANNPHVRVVTFEGADHGFTWPGYPNFHEHATETSWQITLDMLETALGS